MPRDRRVRARHAIHSGRRRGAAGALCCDHSGGARARVLQSPEQRRHRTPYRTLSQSPGRGWCDAADGSWCSGKRRVALSRPQAPPAHPFRHGVRRRSGAHRRRRARRKLGAGDHHEPCHRQSRFSAQPRPKSAVRISPHRGHRRRWPARRASKAGVDHAGVCNRLVGPGLLRQFRRRDPRRAREPAGVHARGREQPRRQGGALPARARRGW